MPWMKLIQPSFKKGMNQRDNLSLLGEEESYAIEGMLIDRNGALFTPKQDVLYTDTAPARIVGMVRHYGTNSDDKRLIVVANGGVYLGTDATGGLGLLMGSWQGTAATVRFLRCSGYTYLFDGTSTVKAYDSVSKSLITVVPTAPAESLTVVPGPGGALGGYFSYKLTAATPTGESNAGTPTTDVGVAGKQLAISGITARPYPSRTKIYRAYNPSDPFDESTALFYYIEETHTTSYLDNLPGGSETGGLYAANLFETAPKFGVEWQDRIVWGKQNTIYLSDPLRPGAVKLLFDVPGAGEIMGLASLAHLCVVFKQGSVHALTGMSTADYRVEFMTENIGCISSDSIAEFENTVFWLAEDSVYMVDAAGNMNNVGKPLEPLITAFPRSRLADYVSAGIFEGRYYLSMDDGTTACTYVYDILNDSWTRLAKAYSSYCQLGVPHDTDFTGYLSPFMAGDDSGDVWQVQASNNRLTAGRIQTRAISDGERYMDKFWRSLRLDAEGSAVADLFLTSGSKYDSIGKATVSGVTRRLLAQTLQGPEVQIDIGFTTGGNEFKLKGLLLEATPRPLR